jgi:predicted TIM-barrel fold metal-dependent hydrolase
LGVERAVLVQPSVYSNNNSAMLDALGQMESGVRAVAVVDPEIGTQELRVLHEAGIRGLRLNLVDRHDGRNVVPAEEVRALARKVAPLGWHLEFLVNLDEAVGFASVVADLPVPIVLGHFGYPRRGARGWETTAPFRDMLKLLDTGRCWVKLTGPYRISQEPDLPYSDLNAAAQRLVQAAPERLLWGTDWPHVMMKKPMPNDGALSDLLQSWIPDERLLSRILRDNPAELYGFARDEVITG